VSGSRSSPKGAEVVRMDPDRARTAVRASIPSFSLPPGQYEVSTDQSYAVPANLSLRQGQLVHADLISSCD
jgi:hypothetical protein